MRFAKPGLMAMVMVAALTACSPDIPADTAEPEGLTQADTPAIIIADVTPTAEQQQKLDQLEAAAKAVDAPANPQESKARWQALLDEAYNVYSDPHPELETIKSEIMFADFLMGDIASAPEILERAIPVYAASGDEWRSKQLEAMGNLSVVLEMTGEMDRSRDIVMDVLELRRAEHAQSPYKDMGTITNNASRAQQAAGNYEAALALNAEAIELHESLLTDHPDLADKLAISYANRLLVLHDMGRFAELRRLISPTLSRIDTILPPDHPTRGYAYQTSAGVLDAAGHTAQSEALIRRAVELRRAAFGDEAANTATSRQLMVSILLKTGKAAEALPLARLNRTIFEAAQGQMGREALLSRENIALARYRLGERDAALAELRSLLSQMEAELPPGNIEVLNVRHSLAELLIESAAIGVDGAAAARDALALLDADAAAPETLASRSARVMLKHDSLRALAATRADKEQSADTILADLTPRLYDVALQEVTLGERSGRQDATLRASISAAFAASMERGDADRAIQLFQMRGLTHAGLSASLARAQDAAPDAASRKRLRERQDAVEVRAAARRDYLAALSDGHAANDLGQTVEALNAQIAALDARLKRDGVPLAGDLATLAAIQSGLATDEAVLLTSETRVGIYTLMVLPNAVLFHAANGPPQALRDQITSLRSAIEPGGMDPLTPDAIRQAGLSLSQALLSEAMRDALMNVSRLNVESHGHMARLPVSVLSLDGTDWWADRFAIRYPLSLHPADDVARKAQSDLFIGVGAPSPQTGEDILVADAGAGTPGPILALRSAAEQSAIADLPPLRFARAELTEIAAASRASETIILTGPEATERTLRDQPLSRAGVLAFATHGVLAGELPGLAESALVLALPEPGSVAADNDGLLSASEIAALELDVDWVILSACHSGGGDTSQGDAFSGLTSAFLQAGAETLLVSHWPVRDDAARFITTRTVAMAADDSGRAVALQAAMKALRESDLPDADHPSVWAPMVLVSR